MRNSKKTQRIIKKLEELEKVIRFYSNGAYKCREDFQEIKDLVEELSLDRKEDHARFAKKLKAFWKNRENTE